MISGSTRRIDPSTLRKLIGKFQVENPVKLLFFAFNVQMNRFSLGGRNEGGGGGKRKISSDHNKVELKSDFVFTAQFIDC